MLDYLKDLYESRIIRFLQTKELADRKVAFVLSGSVDTVGCSALSELGSVYTELIFDQDTPINTIKELHSVLSQETGSDYGLAGLFWTDAGVQHILRIGRFPSPLDHLELACSPDVIYTLPKWNMQKAIVVRDDSGYYESLRRKLRYLDEDEWNDRILSNQFFIRYRTFYDFPRCVKRRQIGSAHLLLGTSHAYLLRFVFLINRQFPPILEGGPYFLMPRLFTDEIRLLPNMGKEVAQILDKLGEDSTIQSFQMIHDEIKHLYDDWLEQHGIKLESDFYNIDEVGHRAAPPRTDRHGSKRGENPFKEDDPRWIS